MAGFPKAGDQYGGRYRIVAEIGHGGMGVVYEALDTVLNRSVALKIVLPSLADRDEYHQRFAQEAAALAKIHSRHIVGIYDYGEHEDTVYFATQFFPDGDLQSWIAEHGPLDRRAALSLVAQVSEALADAHAAGVVHRDVKPGNVLLWSRPEGLVPYLADFGIAVEGAPEKRSGLTRTGTLIGSPAYMAPERHFGHPADERGDVYSAGCLLWAVLTGDAPYAGTDFQMMNSHINAPVVTLGTDHPVDLRIDDVLALALEKDPARRIQSAAEMRAQLLDIVREIDSAALPVPLPPTALPPTGGAPDPNVDSGRTAVRPALVPTPPAPPAEPAAGGSSSGPPPVPVAARERQQRRWLLPVLLSAALVLVVAIVTAVLINRNGDEVDPVADPTTSTSTSESATPPATPKAPRVTAQSAYRAVAFTVTPPPGDDVKLQVFRDGAWAPLKRESFRVTTTQGGDRACLRARAVRSSGGQTASSPGEKQCGKAEARTIALTANKALPCSYSSGGYTYPCWWYELELAGFAPNSSQDVVLQQQGQPACQTDSACQTVPVSKTGRVTRSRFFAVAATSGPWTVTVDGQKLTLETLAGPYSP
ncbi:serine/threonine-protein kinase [Nocardioides mangrovi]|uniref:non-specific serine/threonine protein kinase n=1 Tax=Nocardioides mangrovi TaxID=2874580 RepID=A0ABS7UHR6_9ACTN|nr:serine/threonine-protein kinase [Nocardioides mangrovi]MBZ5740142.1 serine/threonine protein kinase [Nocardioides mangrovi]